MTIPGVAFVIDSGFKKEKEYVFRNAGALEHLRKKGISKASAWQRTGRAGREVGSLPQFVEYTLTKICRELGIVIVFSPKISSTGCLNSTLPKSKDVTYHQLFCNS